MSLGLLELVTKARLIQPDLERTFERMDHHLVDWKAHPKKVQGMAGEYLLDDILDRTGANVFEGRCGAMPGVYYAHDVSYSFMFGRRYHRSIAPKVRRVSLVPSYSLPPHYDQIGDFDRLVRVNGSLLGWEVKMAPQKRIHTWITDYLENPWSNTRILEQAIEAITGLPLTWALFIPSSVSNERPQEMREFQDSGGHIIKAPYTLGAFRNAVGQARSARLAAPLPPSSAYPYQHYESIGGATFK